jgi:dTDP-4-dehydrorhamnose reductase
MIAGPVAITGARGRLGRALVGALISGGVEVRQWSRPEYDLDETSAADRLLEGDNPAMVIHCAAWTDVDGCARDPALARRRNTEAVAELAASCRSSGISLVLISTNEVFDGRRTDGAGYAVDDATIPINEYGASKLAGENAARSAYLDAVAEKLWVVRTSWLYGPPGADFPHKILAAANRLSAGESLRVVADEFGSPTYTEDLASAVLALLSGDTPGGTYHLVNGGHTSRAGWAERILAAERLAVPIDRISQRDFQRASSPPAWGVLDASLAASLGVALRPWEEAVDDYMARSNTSR